MKRVWVGLFLACSVFWNCNLSAETLQEQMNKAKALYDQEKFREAADFYKNILIQNKDELKNNNDSAASVWQAFGEALAKAGWKEQADKAFKRATDRRPKGGIDQSATLDTASITPPDADLMNKYQLNSLKNPKAQEFYRRGAAYLEENHPLYAILEFEKCLEIEADNIEMIEITGKAMAEYGEVYFDKAKDYLLKVRKIKTDSGMTFELWLNLGRACTQAKKCDFKTAEEALNIAIKAQPQNFLANYYMGDLFLIRGDYAKAIEWFEKAKKINGSDLRPLWGIGDANSEMKEYHKALEYYSQAYEMSKENAEAAYKLGFGLKNVGRVDDSIHFHELAISLDPTKARYPLGLVAIYLPRIMDFSAKKHLDAALALEPENPWCHYYYGLYLEMRRRIDEAIQEYTMAAYYGPQMLDAKYQLANIFSAVGNKFPGNNFSCENPSDKLEYLAYKDSKRAYRLYKEILSINPKYVHAKDIAAQLAGMEELFDAEQRVDKAIDQIVK